MTKPQLNVRIPNFTREQIDRIAQHEEMTPGEVVALAVDRLYQQEKNAMGVGELINKVWSSWDWLQGVDPDEMDD